MRKRGGGVSDLIERSDAIEAVRECRTWHFYELVPVLSVIKDIPTIPTKQVKYFDEDEKVWKIGSVIVDE